MKFKFPLQKVLEHRNVVKGLAEKEFQIAQNQLMSEEQNLKKLIDDLRGAREKADDIARNGSSGAANQWQQIHEFTLLQARRIESQRAKVLEAEKLVEGKREILRQKAIDSKIIEKLKERRKAQHAQEVRVREQKEADELNILRFESKDGE